jgi:hypothetical protein
MHYVFKDDDDRRSAIPHWYSDPGTDAKRWALQQHHRPPYPWKELTEEPDDVRQEREEREAWNRGRDYGWVWHPSGIVTPVERTAQPAPQPRSEEPKPTQPAATSPFTPAGDLRMRAAHEVGHYLAARHRGLKVASIDIIKNGDRGGQADIPDLHRAPLLDQVCVYRAGIVAADMIGLRWDHGRRGDFQRINQLLAGCTGEEHRAMVARADRFVEKTLRENWDEFQRLVAELVAKKTITFEQPKPAARATIPAPKPAAPTVQVRKEMLPLMTRSATLKAAGGDEYDVVFSTGATVRRRDVYGEPFDEQLLMGADNVDLSRLASGKAPLLASHDASSLSSVIGVVTTEGRERHGTRSYSLVES